MTPAINRRYLIRLLILKRYYRRRRRWWIRPVFLRREQLGEFILVREMSNCDPELFYKSFRMSPIRFQELLSTIRDRIEHFSNRTPISPAERLAITLRFLSTGDSQQTISTSYRMGKSTVHYIINETCEAIWDKLSATYLKVPDNNDWYKIRDDFWKLWNFPNCCGALDGKHIRIRAPINTGSDFFNYKGHFSIVLLVLCDANYCISVLDLGSTGRESDAGIFGRSKLYEMLDNNSIGFPGNTNLPNSETNLPNFIVSDEAFPLKSYLMRPYPGKHLSHEEKVYNYRLSRARRVVENTFGIMCSRWRLLFRAICANEENINHYVKAICVLHNFLMKKNLTQTTKFSYCPPGYMDVEESDGSVTPGEWRGVLPPNDNMLPHASNRSSSIAQDVRNTVKNFVNNEGSVPWQNTVVNRGRRLL